MNIVAYSWWLAIEAIKLIFICWPVSVLLVALALGLVRLDGRHVPDQGQSLASVLLMFPALSLIWGGLARVDEPAGGADLWRIVILALIVIAQAVASLAVVYVSHGQRGRTGGLAVLIAWFGLLCAHMSRLAVTGMLPLGPES